MEFKNKLTEEQIDILHAEGGIRALASLGKSFSEVDEEDRNIGTLSLLILQLTIMLHEICCPDHEKSKNNLH